MGMWTAIALISIASMFCSVYGGRKKRHHSVETTDELAQLRAKVDALESDLRERVETLERIITNPKDNLKRQFDYLDKAS
jgi:hypothetical protein